MLLVDTNVLVHAVNRASPKHGAAREALHGLGRGAAGWALSWTGVYEFLRVATHVRVLPTPMALHDAWDFVGRLTGAPSAVVLTETGEHARAVDLCIAESPRLRGNIVHDFHTAVLMREHGVEAILTEDRDFVAFPWVRIRRLEPA